MTEEKVDGKKLSDQPSWLLPQAKRGGTILIAGPSSMDEATWILRMSFYVSWMQTSILKRIKELQSQLAFIQSTPTDSYSHFIKELDFGFMIVVTILTFGAPSWGYKLTYFYMFYIFS